jgi:pimeloyl-ACP methyl ester carboxylesterase
VPGVRVNRAELRYEVHGDGRQVLFMHGTGTYSAVWGPTIEHFPPGFRLISYDRRGFGGSTGAASQLTEHVDDAAALIEQLEVAPTAIVAQSGAGPIALRLAIERPELVEALILAEPAYQVTRVRPSAAAARSGVRMIYRWRVRRDPKGAALGYYRWASRYVSGGNAFDRYPEEWRRTALDHAESALREVLQLSRPLPHPREVREIACPVTLVMADNGEPVFRRTTQRVRDLLPDAELEQIHGASHLMFNDRPGEFASATVRALS